MNIGMIADLLVSLFIGAAFYWLGWQQGFLAAMKEFEPRIRKLERKADNDQSKTA